MDAGERPHSCEASYSGKHKNHGMNVQVLADPAGQLLWASPALPGTIPDVRAAREHGIVDVLTDAGIKCWADKGYRGSEGTVRVPCWGVGEPLHGPAGRQPVSREDPSPRRAGPSPPSKPGVSSANCAARPPASPASSRPYSPCIWQAQS